MFLSAPMSEKPSIALRGGLIITQDEKRRVTRGDVLIKNGRVDEVGDRVAEKADTEIDASRHIVAPGFINLHTHIANALIKGIADDVDFGEFLNRMFARDAKRTEEDIEAGALLGGAEMLLSGSTSFLDMYYGMDSVARACETLGLRGFLGWAVLDKEFTTQEGVPLENAAAFIRRWKGNPLVTPLPAPQGVYVVGEETWVKSRELAEREGTVVHYHLSETLQEVEGCVAKTGLRPVEWLDKIGFLGPHQIAAHAVWLKNNEIEILGKRHVATAHCPSSNMKLACGGGGVSPVTELREKGVAVGIGTDSSTSSNTLSMLRLVHMTGLVHKHARHDPKSLPAQELMDMATVEPAKALGLQGKLGEIVPGAFADIVLYDLKHPSLAPVTPSTALSNLVYSANEGAIDSVFVGGRQVVDHRNLTGISTDEIVSKVSKFTNA